MDKKVTYHEQTDVENTLRLRDVLKTLPPFCRDFFRAIEPRTTTKTRISYAYDIRIFFQFLMWFIVLFSSCHEVSSSPRNSSPFSVSW